MIEPRHRARRFVPYVSFAAFGVFWGTWGASLPSLQTQAGVTTSELGGALLFVGAGALPAMAFTGRLVDRFGSRVSSVLLALLAVAGMGVGVLVHDAPSLIGCMAIVGAVSGATDVSINAVAVDVEITSSRPVLTRSHGFFSVLVVAATLAAGAVLESTISYGPAVVFVISGALILVAAVAAWVGSPAAIRPPQHAPSSSGKRALPQRAVLVALVAVGAVGALAYAIENAYQSWGAVFVVDSYGLGPGVAAIAPATFAAIAAIARLTLASLSRSHPAALLVGGGAVAAVGSLVVACSTSAPMAFAGIAAAALGTATLFPTLLSRVLQSVPASRRGAVTSLVATVAYVGFLAGPACMGLVAGIASLRFAFAGVAATAVVFALVSAWVVARAAVILIREQALHPELTGRAARE